MFRTTLKDRPAERREIRKELPFSITPIGGPDELKTWKAEQARKEILFQEQKQQRRDRVVAAMEDGSLINKVFTESETTALYKRYSSNQTKKLAALRSLGVPVTIANPWYIRFYNQVLNFFLNINFTQR